MKLSLLPASRRAFWGGAIFLALSEALASLTRAHFLPEVPFLEWEGLWLAVAVFKGLIFGPILGSVTLRAWEFWRQQEWDEACHLCLRFGFAISALQSTFALACFLGRSQFPFLAWLASSWLHFAFWLTLNVALIWALLLLVAGFLLPSDAKKTVQVGESLRF